MIGGGYLTGVLNGEGEMTGDEIAYIYPDFKTALIGSFEKGFMKSAREGKVVGELLCDSEWGLPFVDFLLVEENEVIFSYDPATNESFGSSPHLPDPMDAANVEVKASNVAGGGEGAFALRDLDAGDVVALYNGLIYTKDQRDVHLQKCHNNDAFSVEERRACTKYQIELDTAPLTIDFPPWMDGSQHYSATSAHKVNCAFGEEANAAFFELEHPRFGLILSAVAKRPIKKGEEIFVDYGYSAGAFPADHPWYHEAKSKWLRSRREKLP